MNYSARKSLAALASITGLFAAFAVSSAFAQTGTPPPDEAVKLETFEVTGTRLTGAGIEGSLSVSLYKMDEMANIGYSNFGELLRKKLYCNTYYG